MELDIYVVDAFTHTQFHGNPAAVVPLQEWLDDATMLAIAAENNLSETAFLCPLSPGRYAIRWFSPLQEIDFCGHATLASSYVLFHEQPFHQEKTAETESVFETAPVFETALVFETEKVGALTVTETSQGRIEMSFPNLQPAAVTEIPPALLSGLSARPASVLRNNQAYFAVYDTEETVRQLQYDVESLKTLAPYDVVVTAPGTDYDFVSRYFWPASGGHEDPVTGSIHAGLAPFWSQRLNKNELIACQASQREGILYCRIEQERVLVSGHAVLYMKGKIHIPG